jgi:hypothetical protein
MAEEHAAGHPHVVLDGDVFQPLWYNWTFPSVGFRPLDCLVAFYRPMVRAGWSGFPIGMSCWLLLSVNFGGARSAIPHGREGASKATLDSWPPRLPTLEQRRT